MMPGHTGPSHPGEYPGRPGQKQSGVLPWSAPGIPARIGGYTRRTRLLPPDSLEDLAADLAFEITFTRNLVPGSGVLTDRDHMHDRAFVRRLS
jgi:hypothetical protein